MNSQIRCLPLVAAAMCGALVSGASGQAVAGDGIGRGGGFGEAGGPAAVGPHETLGLTRAAREQLDLSEAALLLMPHEAPPGGYSNLSPSAGTGSNGGAAGAPDGRGGGERYVDQPINCDGTGWFSNSNSTISPYFVFDDFVADGTPLVGVQFYGGIYGGSGSLSAIETIGVQIWTIAPGGECGWTYEDPVYIDDFAVNELRPRFECEIASGQIDAYEFTANLEGVPALEAGREYMITIYARLANPGGQELFAWGESPAANHHAATSWDRSTNGYARCSPDMAFRTITAGSCQEQDGSGGSYYSNFPSNTNSYIVFDDFTAVETGLLRRVQFTGGMFDAWAGTGADFENLAGFEVEIHRAVADGDAPCGNRLGGIVGGFTTGVESTNPRYVGTDGHGINHYEFTVEAPDVFTLEEGERYHLMVYGIPLDPDSYDLFAWKCTDGVYGLTSWSYNVADGFVGCHGDADMAFCVDAERPCFADFNGDGEADVRDVLAFLNAWTQESLEADMDYSQTIDTRDVLEFLNVWNGKCPIGLR